MAKKKKYICAERNCDNPIDRWRPAPFGLCAEHWIELKYGMIFGAAAIAIAIISGLIALSG